MVAILLIAGVVWVALSGTFVLALCVAAKIRMPAPEADAVLLERAA
ncbi:MAG TPA: hypothetical protein VK846_09520 [Candidatus Limnocylindria bacterium]|nr:hypothetical protein [Candidatus Limnocylindria bacterium]